MEETPYRLHSVSVVVTAESHNPSILNRDFLASREIVPSDWETYEVFNTPSVSQVRYKNGIEWTVDQSILTVIEVCESPFRDDYRVYGLVCAYLSELPHVPYRSLGLNCVVSLKQDAPAQWLNRRFLKSDARLAGQHEIIGLEPRFVISAGDAICNLALSEGQVQSSDGGVQEQVIVANANVHHAGPLDAESLIAAIEQWPQRQEFLISTLNHLLRQTQK